MKKKTRETYPIHKMGKTTGYDLYEDGSIKICPSLYQEIDKLLNEEIAIDRMIKCHAKTIHELMSVITKRVGDFWDKATEEFNLDTKNYRYTYHPLEKKITRRELTNEDIAIFSEKEKEKRIGGIDGDNRTD